MESREKLMTVIQPFLERAETSRLVFILSFLRAGEQAPQGDVPHSEK